MIRNSWLCGQQACFDVQDFAAGFGPGHSGGHARRQILAAFFRQKRLRTEQIGKFIRFNCNRLNVALGEFERHFSG